MNYTYPSPANNEQIVTVGLPKGKVHTLTFFSYPKGLNENPLQGFLKSIAQGAKTTTYAWVPSVVIGQMPAAGTSYADSAMASVNRYRKSAETISHHGSYGRSFSAFDEYDNPTLFTEAGLNGGTQISRPIAASYFNSNPLQVMTGSDHWWLLGLQKSVSSNSKNLWAADYDAQGSLTYKIVNGVRTDYAYTPVAFSNCLASLANFQWGSFISCAANYLFGDYHTGLVYEESIGVGLLVTKFAAYEKGVPQRVLLSNGGEEKNEVDDYGNITQHISPTGVISDFKYDPAGELYEETPAVGLAKTSIVRNGFAVTRTVATGAAVHSTTTDTYDGFGRRIISTVTSGGRSIHKRWILDEFGRVGTDVFSADSSNATAGIVYTYDAFDRVLTELNGTASYTYCYQSCGADVGSLIRVSNSLNDQVVVTSYYALGSFSTGLTAKIEQRGADGSSMLTETSYDPSRLVPTSSSRGRSTQSYLYNASRQLERITDNASGIKEFSYDAAGRTKTVTTADGVVETHHYYGLGDLLQKRSLSAGGGEISYEYNLAGQIKKSTSAHAVLDFSRDIYGRIDQLTQTLTLPNQTARPYAVGYGYNSIGQVISLTFPGGKSVDLSNQNAFGHISSIPQIADSLSYDASGNLKTFQRQDISWARAYAANGRLESIVSSGSLRCHYSVAYGYDALHRINKVTDNCGENDNIDLLTRWGTGQIKRVSGGMIAGNAGSFDYTYNHDDVASITRTVGLGAPQAMTFTYQGGGTSPRLGSITSSPYVMAYDAVGRITSDGGSTFTYDGFGRVLTQTDAQSSRLFYYAADNLRVAAKTTTGSNIQETDYVYGLSGELLYELNRTSQLAKHYIHVAGQLLATIETYPDADTDGDGMVDEEEVENGLNPLLAGDTVVDTDGDGLPDWQERLWGLDPTNPDTDGDGANDGDEVNQLGLAAALDSSKKPRVRCLICWLIPVIT
ncbi:MAG: hypothetical protein Q8J78_15700 [Moraxellaceae bacterium]|nr:hypothetical protein [Moraxellaceae bacterium]